MTGMRQVTTSTGLLESTPPDEVMPDVAPTAAVELAHWGFGAGAGAVYGLLPERVRRRRLAGPLYGVAIWLFFELAMAPALNVQIARRNTVSSRLMLVADHVLYGTILAGKA